MLSTGEEKSSHITKGCEGFTRTIFFVCFCMKPSVSPSLCVCGGGGVLGVSLMLGLQSMLQLRVVTSLMQNVTMAPKGQGSLMALLNASLYTNLLIPALQARGCWKPCWLPGSWISWMWQQREWGLFYRMWSTQDTVYKEQASLLFRNPHDYLPGTVSNKQMQGSGPLYFWGWPVK